MNGMRQMLFIMCRGTNLNVKRKYNNIYEATVRNKHTKFKN